MLHKASIHLMRVCVWQRETDRRRKGASERRALSNIKEGYFRCLIRFHWWNDECHVCWHMQKRPSWLDDTLGNYTWQAVASGQSGEWGGEITTGSAKKPKGRGINGWQISSDLSSLKPALTEQKHVPNNSPLAINRFCPVLSMIRGCGATGFVWLQQSLPELIWLRIKSKSTVRTWLQPLTRCIVYMHMHICCTRYVCSNVLRTVAVNIIIDVLVG